jgi:Zn-dependent protease
MSDFAAWSLSLGRCHGVRVRLHVFFLLFAVQALYMASLTEDREMIFFAAASLVILLASVILHELGHCLAAMHLGGQPEVVVLWPLGGLNPPYVPHEPQLELMTALAGPAVNLLIMLLIGPLLLAGGQDLLGLLMPLAPANLTDGPLLLVALKLAFWINWLLVLVNLFPAFPFDGGRVLRSLLWSQFDYRLAVLWVTRTAMAFALVICFLAWWMKDAYTAAFVPAWVPMLLFAIFLWFGAQQEEARLEYGGEDDLFGYDFSQGYTSLERDGARARSPGPIRRWLNDRREARIASQAAREREEEQLMDAILARLHETGVEGLSPNERTILERVSARYRNRQQS